ncbi:quinolinate synthase NadA [uncultured Clostridium sp.]|uniref:quinolinate synthase NadA n=1 Tax=uncultured Clostridium sp. TaxID=59620 RepID=UPI002603353F|nr:quinolinate synthase NadA [uncultured Clostridium sp.]
MDYIEGIQKLKKEKGALILAHYYQNEEIKALADYIGDSYYLSKIAKESLSEFIVFCGVNFMAESAKILSPNKRVFIPVKDAGCIMADMVNSTDLLELKSKYDDVAIVTYINSSTEVKAISDVIVTSSNAQKIVSKIKNKNIIFAPDRNLGSYIGEQIEDKNMILWQGFCPIHESVAIEEVIKFREKYSNSIVLTHPECQKEIRDISTYVGSTSGILAEANKYTNKDILIVTEEGMISDLKNDNPNNNRYHTFTDRMICCNMKKIKVEDLYLALLEEKEEIFIENDLIRKASVALNKMHELAN